MDEDINAIWKCPYAPIYCYSLDDCDFCWMYLSLEIYGIQQMLEKITDYIEEGNI